MKLLSLIFPTFAAAAGLCLCGAPSARAAVDTVTSTADSGPGTLRNTIAAATAGDTIVFSPALAGQTIYLTSGELVIGQNLTIDASQLVGGVAIDGGGNSRVLEISGSTVTMDALTLTNGYVDDDFGGGIFLDETNASLTATNCAFRGNVSNGEYGGAIATYGNLTLDNCSVSNNSASIFGGGIFNFGGIVTLNGCAVSGNDAQVGGGIENEIGALTLNHCAASSNVASAFGGAIDSENGGTLALTNCVFAGNAGGAAGALSIENTAVITSCIFSNNIATNGTGGAGGAIATYDAITLNNCDFSGNRADNGGLGGGMINSGSLTMSHCVFDANVATNGYGGGLYNPGTAVANGCLWSANQAFNSAGGGIYNGGTLTLNNCTLYGNSATNGAGGGLFSQYATNTLINCTICENSAPGGSGGGFYNGYSSAAMLTNTIVAENTAENGADVDGSFSGLANFVGGNPQLAALDNYGGPTDAMPPEFGSPVIDAGTDWVTNFLAADQRGFPRLAGVHVDIGAAEAQTAAADNPPVLKDARTYAMSSQGFPLQNFFAFSFTNAADADFTVLTTTNLAVPSARWTVWGNVSQLSPPMPPGEFSVVGLPTFNPQAFYRVVSP